MVLLEKEMNVFDKQLPDLLEKSAGKFVLIKEDEIIGVYEAREDALRAGYEKFRQEPFLVREIVAIPEPLNFASNFLLR